MRLLVGAPLAGYLADRAVINGRARRGGEWVPEDRLRATLFGALVLVPLSVLLSGIAIDYVHGAVGIAINVVCLFVNGVAVRQIPMLIGAILLCGLATGMYISANFGPGPRDGLMTGLAARTGLSIRLTRTMIEATVLVTGWLLGGSVGIGTVAFALGIGPAAQFFLRLLAIPTPVKPEPVVELAPAV